MSGQASNPVEVIGRQFLTQARFDLTIAKDGKVTDVDGEPIFGVKIDSTFFHDFWHLEDPAGDILVTGKKKIKTLHGRRQVFSGVSTGDNDLLFTVKKGKQKKLDVFLASNISEKVPDFKVEGVYFRDGKSNVTIAQMVNNTDNIAVQVHPNVDYAFVVALVVAVTTLAVGGDTIGKAKNLAQAKKLAKWAAKLGKWVLVLVPLLTQ